MTLQTTTDEDGNDDGVGTALRIFGRSGDNEEEEQDDDGSNDELIFLRLKQRTLLMHAAYQFAKFQTAGWFETPEATEPTPSAADGAGNDLAAVPDTVDTADGGEEEGYDAGTARKGSSGGGGAGGGAGESALRAKQEDVGDEQAEYDDEAAGDGEEGMYYDEDGNEVYYDEDGNEYYYDEEGNVVYFDEDGNELYDNGEGAEHWEEDKK